MDAIPALVDPASFRDPSGFVFRRDGKAYRQVNSRYAENYELLISSGLYKTLSEQHLLIPHDEVSIAGTGKESYKTLLPRQLTFLSYPYEWSFGQLKDAALTTLRIQFFALEHGLSLKDASAYNIQFEHGKPILIDTISFEKYPDGKPWIAYRQFCQHFLAPLALMAKVDLRLGTLSQLYLDGIPLDLASGLLPNSSKLSPGLGAHLHLHARSQRNHANPPSRATATFQLSKGRLLGILQSLESTIRSLRLPDQKTTWQDYYENTNYTTSSRSQKEEVVKRWITKVQPRRVWDAGANDGSFSRLASAQRISTIATDIDPQAVDRAYRQARTEDDSYLLPLILDLTNPTPAVGWDNQERPSLIARLAGVDLVLCLAFVHHLAIANNLPLSRIASLFSHQSPWLIIEFVPKEDSNARRLLAAREDIFPDYTRAGFEKAFSSDYTIVERESLAESSRTLYLLKRKGQ